MAARKVMPGHSEYSVDRFSPNRLTRLTGNLNRLFGNYPVHEHLKSMKSADFLRLEREVAKLTRSSLVRPGKVENNASIVGTDYPLLKEWTWPDKYFDTLLKACKVAFNNPDSVIKIQPHTWRASYPDTYDIAVVIKDQGVTVYQTKFEWPGSDVNDSERFALRRLEMDEITKKCDLLAKECGGKAIDLFTVGPGSESWPTREYDEHHTFLVIRRRKPDDPTPVHLPELSPPITARMITFATISNEGYGAEDLWKFDQALSYLKAQAEDRAKILKGQVRVLKNDETGEAEEKPGQCSYTIKILVSDAK